MIKQIASKALAKKLGIKSQTLTDYEAGRRSNLGVNVIKRFINKISVFKKFGEKNGLGWKN